MSLKKISDYYDAKSKYYELFNEETFERTNKEINFYEGFFKKFNIKVRRILDIGCGTGRLSIALAKRGYDVVGIDISNSKLD